MTTQPGAIPDALTDRDQWICWRTECRECGERLEPTTKECPECGGKATKKPIDPHTADYASSTDADTWGSVGDAIEHDDGNADTDGIGFVFDAEGLVAGVDLDGCRDPETGELDAWAEEVVETLDSFTEVSPSGTGLHVYVFGFIPDGGNRNDGVGLEMYDSGRFFTVTGEHVDGTPDTVEQRQDAFRSVHEEYIAEDDGEDGPDTEPPGDVDLDDSELIERAMDAENGDRFERLWNGDTSMYDDDHSRADLALLCHLAFWTGGDRSGMERLFERSALSRDKWHDRKDYRDRTIDAALAKTSEFYDGGADGPTEPPKLEDGDDEDDYLTDPEPFLSEKNGCWGRWKGEGEDKEWVEVMNCTLDVQARVTTPDGEEQLRITVRPRAGEPYDVTVRPKVFNDKRRFKDEVLKGRTVTFSGRETQLNKVKKAVGHQPAPSLTGTHQTGLHDGVFVTPSGVLTADGWEDQPSMELVEREIGFERKWTLGPDDGDEPDAEMVRSIASLLPRTRDTNRFIPALAWFCAATVRPIIKEETGQFNLLAILGETGSGKTSTLRTLSRAFGMDGYPFSASDTKFTLTATLAATNAVPVWFDEYKPSEMKDRELDRFHMLLRKTTLGGVEQRGRSDRSTDEYRLEAPVAVSGEERIHGSAEERRGIFTTFKAASTEPGTETSRAFSKLTGNSFIDPDTREAKHFDGFDLRQHALAFYQFVLGMDDEEIIERWRKQERRVSDLLAANGHERPDDLPFQGLQTVAFGGELYQAFADAYDAEPVGNGEIDAAILYLAENAIGGTSRRSHWETFLAVATRAAVDGAIERGVHYDAVHDGRPDAELRIHMGTAVDKVNRYVREHDVSEDLLGSADDYRARAEDDVDDPRSPIASYSQKTPGIGRCVGIHIASAAKKVPEFDPAMWGIEPVDVERDEAAAKVATDGSGEPTQSDARRAVIEAVRENGRDYPATTGEIRQSVGRSVDLQHHLDKLTEDGTITDTGQDTVSTDSVPNPLLSVYFHQLNPVDNVLSMFNPGLTYPESGSI